ncbi:MAG: hypothetical protein GX996_05315 [Firmicutes bacterium]|nr:hypothetical protein [Bacillota bacterium]
MRSNLKKEELSNVSLLIFLLVNFPQIFTINYNLGQGKIIFSFMLKVNITRTEYIEFRKEFYSSVKAYNELLNIEGIPRLKRRNVKSWTLLQVIFKRKSIDVEEVNLVSSLILKWFKNNIIFDVRNDNSLKTNGEEFIEYLLPQKKQSKENLLAFREAGKVYVFDK